MPRTSARNVTLCCIITLGVLIAASIGNAMPAAALNEELVLLYSSPALGGVSNPFFYEVFARGEWNENSGVIVGEPATLKFTGLLLSSLDKVKLVEDGSVTCKDGPPGGGVGEPKVELMEQTDTLTVTYWNFTIKKRGSYRVCYFVNGENRWGDVSFRRGREIPDIHTSTEPPSTEPPTENCPHYEGTMKDYVGVKVELKRSLNVEKFEEELSKILCLKPNEIITERASVGSKKVATWYFTISCSACDAVERYNYLATITSKGIPKSISDAKIISIEGLYSIPLDVDIVRQHHSGFLFLLTSLFFLSGGAMFLFGVHKYRERREDHFGGLDTSFGLADGDIEDLFPPAQPGLMNEDDTNAVEAYIEVEE